MTKNVEYFKHNISKENLLAPRSKTSESRSERFKREMRNKAYTDYFKWRNEPVSRPKRGLRRLFDLKLGPYRGDLIELRDMVAFLEKHPNRKYLDLSHLNKMIVDLENLEE